MSIPADGLVLLVEDDDDLREAEAGFLSRAGFRVASARDGREALDLIAQGMPAVIFLDMRMPGMDGWAFAREFHARHGQGAPIIVVTAAANARDSASAIAADGCLGKPFEPAEFVGMARTYVHAE